MERPGFIFPLVIIGLISSTSPLVAEQYRDKLHEHTLSAGRTTLVDPKFTVPVLLHDDQLRLPALPHHLRGEARRFLTRILLPTFISLLIPPVLVWDNKRYHKTPPRGSVLLDSASLPAATGVSTWSGCTGTLPTLTSGSVPSPATPDLSSRDDAQRNP